VPRALPKLRVVGSSPIVRSKRAKNLRSRERNKLLGRTTAHWDRVQAAVRARDGGCCRECGSTHYTTVHMDEHYGNDHRLATPEMCVTLCVSCHSRLHATKQR
jgi:5-methylcytosine-specific restriction endonuclease McrA